ncbi:MAG: 2,3-bisphosphoglycerate-independent phosphoglycerate mutase [Chloroflexi bacterium]|nr:2,3-bisphosphoglycerate-independent phosphoglycerate mutase [Chloroflexota bacterium]
MITLEEINQISVVSPSKIVMLVIDGLGGLPDPKTGKTELETAHTSNFDSLAENGACGLIDPVSPGVTPGSGPGHLALFGYDPLRFTIGRGVLEALGIGFELKETDVAARGNFCTVDDDGVITDRRAGRITTDKCAELCEMLSQIKLEGVELFALPVKEHRFLFVMRGEELAAEVNDTDPQRIGVAPNMALATESQAKNTAHIVNEFVDEVQEILARHQPANMILLRGFSKLPDIPSMGEIYKLKPAAIACYPMYKGLARLVGMKVFNAENGIEEELKILADCYSEHDFFYIHVKESDSAGEDGDFSRKVKVIERVDYALPQLLKLTPEVIVVTGDHSTPALLKGHSWHPVPILLYSQWCRRDKAREFSESACASGGLGRLRGTDIMLVAMANALKLTKFGA